MAAVLGWKANARWTGSRVLRVALLASIALHFAVLFGLPELIEAQRKALFPGTLSARLVSPPPVQSQAEPVPVSAPRAPRVPRVPRSAPVPSRTAPAAPEARGSEPGPVSSAVLETPQQVMAPAPAFDEAGTIAQYRIALMGVARSLKTYPRLAQENNWQGRIELRITVGPGGALASAAIKSGTGYAVLDQHALDMVRRAQPKTPLPAGLRGRGFSLEVPVVFSLKDG